MESSGFTLYQVQRLVENLPQSLKEALDDSLKVREIKVREATAGSIEFAVSSGDHHVAAWTMTHLPNSNILWSSGAYVAPSQRGKGLGRLFNLLRIHIAWQTSHALMMCSVNHRNEPQKALLEKNKWREVEVVTNGIEWGPPNGAEVYNHEAGVDYGIWAVVPYNIWKEV